MTGFRHAFICTVISHLISSHYYLFVSSKSRENEPTKRTWICCIFWLAKCVPLPVVECFFIRQIATKNIHVFVRLNTNHIFQNMLKPLFVISRAKLKKTSKIYRWQYLIRIIHNKMVWLFIWIKQVLQVI